MPWISERADELGWALLEALMHETLSEARRRVCAAPRRVLLLPPDITRAHSGVGRLTEMLYRELAAEAEVHVIPTLGQHVPHTADENRRMFGSIPQEQILRPRLARRLRAGGRGFGRRGLRCLRRRGRLADSRLAQPHADGRAVGPGDQRRPRRAARSAGLCQPQQELLHRPGRQGHDLRLAHAGGHLRHRKQSRLPGHADAGLLQQGRRSAAGPAARLVRAGRAGPQRRRRAGAHRAYTSATIWKPTSRPPGSRARRTSRSSTSRSRRSYASCRATSSSAPGSPTRPSTARGWPWPTAAS